VYRIIMKEEAEIYKIQGNEQFKDGNFENALECFTKAITLDSSNHILYSNRSATYVNLDLHELAVEDAHQCIDLQPKWSKGYLRLGTALFNSNNIREAAKAFHKGLELEPQNASLKDGLKSCLPGLSKKPTGKGSSKPTTAKRAKRSKASPSFAGKRSSSDGSGESTIALVPDITTMIPTFPNNVDLRNILTDPDISGLLNENPAVLLKVVGKIPNIQDNPMEVLHLLNDADSDVKLVFQRLVGKMMKMKDDRSEGLPDFNEIAREFANSIGKKNGTLNKR